MVAALPEDPGTFEQDVRVAAKAAVLEQLVYAQPRQRDARRAVAPVRGEAFRAAALLGTAGLVAQIAPVARIVVEPAALVAKRTGAGVEKAPLAGREGQLRQRQRDAGGPVGQSGEVRPMDAVGCPPRPGPIRS